MSAKPAPDWLAELQARFGGVLRTPLDRSTGTLRAATADYDAEAVRDAGDRPGARAEDRLAVYNRQYWFRLFGVLQTAFPLAAHVLGRWRFNENAAKFLFAEPPRGWDLERVPDGFVQFLEGEPGLESELALEAARIDAAWRALLRAPAAVPFVPSAEEAAGLLDARLSPSAGAAVLVEHWALFELQRGLLTGRGEDLPAPPRLPSPRWWALVKETEGIRRFALEPREGELLLLLIEHPVRDALARLEAACPEAERAELPAQTRTWLARSAERGLWTTERRS